MTDYFVPDIMGLPLLSFRNGKYFCMDGQHRIEACKRMGYKEVYCQIITDLVYEEECRRFNILNTGRTQLNANQIFHCRVEEKEQTAIELVKMFKKYKYTYNKNTSVKDDNIIGAVSKFDKMFKKYGMTMVERVLCSFEDNNVSVSLKKSSAEYEEEVPLEIPVKSSAAVGFNGRYLLDALNSFDADKVSVKVGTPHQGAIIDDGDMFALVLPVQL